MTWDDVRLEISRERTDDQNRQSPHDIVRRRKIQNVEAITGRPLIIYAVSFTESDKAIRVGSGIQIELGDKTGFDQAISDIPPGQLDILLHSPGGSPAATESLVHQLRKRFDNIRFIVPHTVKSAATMFALSGNEILVGPDAEFGPIDPQLSFSLDGRTVAVPAQAAIDQFERAYEEVNGDPKRMAVWLPILRQYGPSFLQECRNAISLSSQLVTEWLGQYMFAECPEAKKRAWKLASWLADHNNFNTHSRRIGIKELMSIEPELTISQLTEVSPEFEKAVMEVYWAIDVTFDETGAFKLIEHRLGSAFIRLQETIAVARPNPQPQSQPNRQERRSWPRKGK